MATTSETGESFDGQLVLPGDPGFDGARRVWNAMVDRSPRMIVRCASVRDVRAALRIARKQGLVVGVRCGGHSVLGLSMPDDGVMIDLTPMSAVRVDPIQQRAWIQGGALLGVLDEATQKYGLATTAGNVSHTGVGGLTLGGGMGWLARQHGLACDNVVSFELITADGELIRASDNENPDLYWGLRGGGGNFGIVTEFEFALHQVGTAALSVELDFPVDGARRVLAQWRDLNAVAPRQATYAATVLDGVLTVGFVWVGDPEMGRRHARELRALGRPLEERITELSYIELQRREDTAKGHALRRYWKGHFFRDLPDAALDALVEHDPTVAASLQAYGGAIADVDDESTAFSHRDAEFEYVAAARWIDPADDADRIMQARQSAARLAPFASGAYVNTLTDEGTDGVGRAYPPAKLARLTALKDIWDPHNVFHLNQNIPPSA